MLLAIILVATVVLLFLAVGDFAFGRIGFTPLEFALILLGTLLGSSVDIPVHKVTSVVPIVVQQEVRWFWMTYRIPRRALRRVSTVIAVNLGGCIIPVTVSIYLLATHPLSLLPYAIVGTIIASVLIHLVARRVEGVGIVTPAFLPPLFAAITAFALSPSHSAVLAYVCGTLGCLIGADLTNLRHADHSGAQMESIGGAGTFDGIFLTGIIAVVLAAIL